MITKENPVQTCAMDRHKVHETLIKNHANEKVSRTGIKRQNASQNVQNLPNGKYIATQQLCDILHIINTY